MSARTRRSVRPTPDSGELLALLAGQIDEAFGDLTAGEPAQLVRVVSKPDSPEELELGLLPLGSGDHPAEVMAGFTAPADWTAVGVVTTGRSHELDDPIQRRASGQPQAIRLTFLLTRSGEAITLLTPIGPLHASSSSRRVLREPPDGLIADACRRVLGLSTAPPSEGPAAWLTARWLDRLVAAAVARPGAVATWDVAVGLHPLVDPGTTPSPAALSALVDQTAERVNWERLRLLAVNATGHDPAVSPEVAAWMDAGCFARHLLAAELPIDLMVAELAAVVPASVMAAVRESLPGVCGVAR